MFVAIIYNALMKTCTNTDICGLLNRFTRSRKEKKNECLKTHSESVTALGFTMQLSIFRGMPVAATANREHRFNSGILDLIINLIDGGYNYKNQAVTFHYGRNLVTVIFVFL